MRPYFFGEEETAASESHLVESIAEYHFDVLEAILDHRENFEPEDLEAWREWMHQVLEDSPPMRAKWKEGGADWYPSFHEMLGEAQCTRPDKHRWARARSLKVARKALRKRADGADVLPELVTVARAELLNGAVDRAATIAGAVSKLRVRDQWWRRIAGGRRPLRARPVSLSRDLRQLLADDRHSAAVRAGRAKSLSQIIEFALAKGHDRPLAAIAAQPAAAEA